MQDRSSQERIQVIVSTPDDHEGPTAELWVDNVLFAELTRRGARLDLEFFPEPLSQTWRFSLEEWRAALERAEQSINPQ